MILAYLPALSGPWLYEDAGSAQSGSFAVLAPRGLTALTFLATPTPLSAHLVSLGLHLVTGFGLGWLLLGITTPFAAWALSTLFLVHPIQTEAVAYITGRGELLAGLGVLIALWAAVTGRATWLIALGGLLALSAKEATGISLVLWLPLLAWHHKTPWRRVWGPIALWLSVGLLYAWRVHLRAPMASVDWMARQAAAAWHLVRLLLIPVGFSIETPAPFLPWLALVSFAAAIAVCLAARPRWRLLGLWVAAGFLPRMLLAQPAPLIPEPLHEHHFYAVSLGACLCLSLLWPRA